MTSSPADYGGLMAMALLSCVPLLVVFVALRDPVTH